MTFLPSREPRPDSVPGTSRVAHSYSPTDTLLVG